MTNEIEEKIRQILMDIGVLSYQEVNDAVQAILELIKPMEDEIDKLRVQLAGCGVAALGYATGKNDCKKGDYGWSQSFQDVKDLRDKYIKLLKGKPIGKERLIEVIFNSIGGELAEQELLRQAGLSGRTATELEAMKGTIKSTSIGLADAILAEWRGRTNIMTNDELWEAITATKNISTYLTGDANEKHYQVLISLAEQYLNLEGLPEEKLTCEDVWGEEESYKEGFNEALRLCKLAALKEKNRITREAIERALYDNRGENLENARDIDYKAITNAIFELINGKE